jgi:hypothetical protein
MQKTYVCDDTVNRFQSGNIDESHGISMWIVEARVAKNAPHFG